MDTFLAVLTGGGLAALGGLGSGWLDNWMGSALPWEDAVPEGDRT